MTRDLCDNSSLLLTIIVSSLIEPLGKLRVSHNELNINNFLYLSMTYAHSIGRTNNIGKFYLAQ